MFCFKRDLKFDFYESGFLFLYFYKEIKSHPDVSSPALLILILTAFLFNGKSSQKLIHIIELVY